MLKRSRCVPIFILSTIFGQCVCVCVRSSHKPIGPQPYPVIYAVANPVRGLLNVKIPEERLQSSNESIKTKTRTKHKRQKEKNNKLGDAQKV